MNLKIQPIIKTVRELPFLDQLKILQEISSSMSVTFRQSDVRDDFRHPKTLAEHLEKNSAEPVQDIDNLFGEFWPEDETADEFINYTYGKRREDRERAKCQAAGRPISPQDAWICATALQYGLPLVTHNPSDFEAVENLEIITTVSCSTVTASEMKDKA